MRPLVPNIHIYTMLDLDNISRMVPAASAKRAFCAQGRHFYPQHPLIRQICVLDVVNHLHATTRAGYPVACGN